MARTQCLWYTARQAKSRAIDTEAYLQMPAPQPNEYRVITHPPCEVVAGCNAARMASKAWIPCLAAVPTVERMAA